MRLTIQPVLPEDAYAYTLTHIACWQSAYQGIIPDEYLAHMPEETEQRVERLKQSIEEGTDGFSYYYAQLDGKMVGRLILNKSRDEDKPDAGEITAIYLLQDYWDKGYGREMMDYAMAQFEEMGYCEVILWVQEENQKARRFYEKCGFAFDGTKKEITIGKPLVVTRYIRNL